MNTDLNKITKSEVEFRRKRVKRIKRIIIITVLILLIMPTILCAVMFFKMLKLQERIETLEYAAAQEAVISGSYVSADDDLPPVVTPQVNSTKAPASKPEETKDTMNSTISTTKVPTKAPVQTAKPTVVPTVAPTTSPTKAPVEIPKLNKSDVNNPKRIYLTFDDGPSVNTAKILDILKRYNVKATFFVTGKDSQLARDMYKRIVAEGHTLAMHSYSHNYDDIYSSVGAFSKDMNKLSDYLEKVTGVKPKYYRFPGGSSTSQMKISVQNFLKYLDAQGIKYFDWNVQNSDAQKTVLSKEELIANVVVGVNKHKDSIVLMHDAKSRDNTVESLPELIEMLQESGAQILPIDDNTPMVVHVELEK